jgi:hypothetical protein
MSLLVVQFLCWNLHRYVIFNVLRTFATFDRWWLQSGQLFHWFYV